MPRRSSKSAGRVASQPATKGDLAALRTELKGEMERQKTEIIGEFHIVAGQFRHDLIGATKDDLSLLKDTDHKHDARISRLGRHAGLIAA